MHNQKPLFFSFSARLLLVALCVGCFSTDAFAYKVCRCKEEKITPLERYDRAFAVFTGKVTKIQRRLNPDAHHVTFAVYDAWKGARAEEMIVKTSGTDYAALFREGITCGYEFKKGEEYLIFSYLKHRDKGLSYTSDCGNIIPLSHATPYTDYFGKPERQFNRPAAHVVPANPAYIDSTTQPTMIPPTLTLPTPTIPSN